MSPESDEPKIKTETRTRVKWNQTTGKYAGSETYKVITNPQDLSIDELPPPGVEGPLTKEPPQTMGGITAAQIEKDRQESPWVAGIEESQTTGDKE